MSTTLPQLFVIGDSISMHYGPYLETMLAGRYRYARKTGQEPEAAALGQDANGGTSRAVRAWLEAMLASGNFAPDVLLINCGLHDIVIDATTKTYRVSISEYEANLNAIFDRLRWTAITPIWMRTTAVVDEIHNAPGRQLERHDVDHRAYAEVADRVVAAAGIASIDLCGFSESLGTPESVFCDHVHFHDAVRRLQAAHLAGYVFGRLGGGCQR